jgi:hypothetical protein
MYLRRVLNKVDNKIYYTIFNTINFFRMKWYRVKQGKNNSIFSVIRFYRNEEGTIQLGNDCTFRSS